MATAVKHGCGMAHDYGTPCADGRVRSAALGSALREATADWAWTTSAPRYGSAPPRRGPAARSVKAPAKRGLSPSFVIVASTDRRGGRPDDDWALDPAGADDSELDKVLYLNHTEPIGQVLGVEPRGRRLMASVALDLDTEQGAALWRHRQGGGTLGASVQHEVLATDPAWPWRALAWKVHHVSLCGPGRAPVDPGAVSAPWLL